MADSKTMGETISYKDWITLCFRTRAQCLFIPSVRCAPMDGAKICRMCEERDQKLLEQIEYLRENPRRVC